MDRYKKRLTEDSATAKAYYKQDGNSYLPGEIIKLPDLASTLKELKEEGPKAFYEGDIADKIVAAMEKDKGLITHNDLKSYSVSLRRPVEGSYRGYKIVSMPPSL